jgi:hypothetical protein
MSTIGNGSFDRRDAMAALLAGAAAAVAPTAAVATDARPRGGRRPQMTSTFLLLDPVERFRQTMRIQRSLLPEDDILLWYHFIMIAVPVGKAPRAVVRFEGIEFSRHVQIGPDRYRLHGHNLSFPRDLATGEFVTEVLNPLTQKVVPVPPMALTGDPGLIRSPEGVVTLDKPDAAPRADYRMLRREGDLVKVDSIRVPPETWPVTFLETGYEAAPAHLFDDPKQLWLPTELSGAYVFPWPAWMQMGDAPGHMFASWSGSKMRTIDELPAGFRARAQRDYPQLLSVDRSPFLKPLPGVS